MNIANSQNLNNNSDNNINHSIQVSDIPLALYIHIPWCVQKCPYCDFNSHTLHPKTDFDGYLQALLCDLDSQLPLVQGRLIESIFIGGGTPSLFPIRHYLSLFEALTDRLILSPQVEITMEANAGTLEHSPFEDYLSVGINRLSIGVQSFEDEKLQRLGRVHNADQAKNAIKKARQAGFERLNVDLMYGLPNQDPDQAVLDLQMAHHCGATHLSWYQLTIEPNTVFYRNTPVLPNEGQLEAIESLGRETLQALGYQNYEISAWTGLQDRACQHNLNYWQFGDYLAIGAGAHGKISQKSGIFRFSKSRLPKDYLNYQTAPKMASWQSIDPTDLVSDFMMNVLRLKDGVPLDYFWQRTGQDPRRILPLLQDLHAKNLLQNPQERIAATPLGQRYLNQVLQVFL